MSDENPVIGKKIKIGESEFVVSDDVAAALEAQNASIQSYIAQVQEEFQKASNKQEPEASKPQATKKKMNTDKLFANPDDFIAELMEEVEERVAKAKSDATNEIASQRQIEAFWQDFWSKNKDLDPEEDKDIAEFIANRHAQEWSQLTIDKARDKLAEAVRTKLDKIVSRKGKKEEKEPVIQGSGINRFGEKPSAPPEKPKSLSEIIAERQKAMFGPH